MKFVAIFTILCLKHSVRCGDYLDNYVISEPELLPTYDAIMYRDIIDVMNEIDEALNNGYDYDLNFLNDSEGDENNIENLLSEYQRFLDIAHSMRKESEKNRTHNKFPVLDKPKRNNMHHYNYYTSNLKYVPNSMPFSSDILSAVKNKVMNNWQKNAVKIASPFYVPQYPNTFNKGYNSKILQTPRYSMETNDDLAEPEDRMQLNIKVDVKFPKNLEPLTNVLFKTLQEYVRPEDILLGDSLNIPYIYNNPVPNIVGFKPHMYKHEFEPTKKIKITKKKKSRSNKSSRRQKKKKILTIHNFGLDAVSKKNATQENKTCDGDCKHNSAVSKNGTFSQNDSADLQISTTNTSFDVTLSTTETNLNKTENGTESIYLLFNLSSPFDRQTDDSQKIENSIEVVDKSKLKQSTNGNEREIIQKNNGMRVKRSNKISSIYDELLYWPSDSNTNAVENPKNITSMILEGERKKAKLNISNDLMRKNHSMALERAIFGDIDWEDMDTVVPEFISFAGKYLRGVLTFCSESMCHSMKCVEKICLHRVCKPEERFNVKGHCTGKHNNDSVAALESIMDLPSTLALEIVGILERKLRGKMFGKATLCISSKCVTFVASKKSFLKSKCPFKELTPGGHCGNIKAK